MSHIAPCQEPPMNRGLREDKSNKKMTEICACCMPFVCTEASCLFHTAVVCCKRDQAPLLTGCSMWEDTLLGTWVLHGMVILVRLIIALLVLTIISA